jgi:hypothetical protein
LTLIIGDISTWWSASFGAASALNTGMGIVIELNEEILNGPHLSNPFKYMSLYARLLLTPMARR